MKPSQLLRASALLAAVTALSTTLHAQCDQVWSTGWTNYTIGPSHLAAAEDKEVADDFDFTGSVTRLIANGNGPFCCGTTALDGVYVRFYEWTTNGPGALQSEYYLAGDDPHLVYLPLPETVDVALPTPFQASGKHFVSVQLDFESSGYWYWWTGGGATPQLSRAWIRDQAIGGAWGPFVDIFGQITDKDVSFELFGDPTGGAVCYDWNESPTPKPDIAHTILRDLDVLAPNDIWAVGDMQRTTSGNYEMVPVAMHYDGTQWSVVPTPAPSMCNGCAQTWFEAVEAVATDDVWAAGTQKISTPQNPFLGQQVMVQHWDGTSWSVLTNTPITQGGTGAIVYDIEVIASDDVWFFGEWIGPSKTALAMHYDGSSFQIVPTPYFSSSGHSIVAASALASDDIWAVGGAGDGADPAAFSYILHWDGSAWSHVPGPLVGLIQSLNDVVALAPNDVWLCGEAWFSGAIVAMFQHWDGSSWSNVSVPGGGGALFANGPNDIWTVGGTIAHYDGASWSLATGLECIPGVSLLGLDGVGGELWAAGRQTSAGIVPLVAHQQVGGASPVSFYCAAKTNSLGCTPVLTSEGCACDFLAGAKSFTLRAEQLLGAKNGLFFYGTNGPAQQPFQGGELCVKPPLKRLAVQSTGGTNGQCDGSLAVDFNQVIASGIDPQLQLGTQVAIQAWTRDPADPFKTNLTSARLFTISP
ncbi:MAG: hypothetical protein IT453_10105 [Planctomycetes bacterium]|nr:hypothetical protein [Planctomycetota bacterium]